MAGNCFCSTNPYFHKTTALQYVESESAPYVLMTVNNSTNISSLDYFELFLTINPNTVVTGAPVPFKINVNGTDVTLLNRYSLPINSDRLNTRKRYYGAYVAPTAGGSPYVILWNTPTNPAYAE